MPEIKPVREADQFAHDAAVVARIRAAEKRKTWIEAGRWAVVAASIAAGASGWVTWATNPLIRTETIVMPVMHDGTPIMGMRQSELPKEAQKTDIQNSIIEYVLRREEFYDLTAERNYAVTSRLSSKKVREEYQAINDMALENSQWKQYSGGGWIMTSFDSMEDLPGPEGYKDMPPGYTVRFCRQVKRKDKTLPDRPEIWAVSVGFKANVEGYDTRIILAHNPARIQITDYRNVRRVGPLVNNFGVGGVGSC